MKSIKYIAVLLTLCVMANSALASGSQEKAGVSEWKVTFEDNGKAPEGSVVSVVFVAAGCAGVKRCGNYPTRVVHVCKQALNVKPGETTKHSYTWGTSSRVSIICSNADSSSTFANKARESSKKNTYVCAEKDGSWSTYDTKDCTKKVGSRY